MRTRQWLVIFLSLGDRKLSYCLLAPPLSSHTHASPSRRSLPETSHCGRALYAKRWRQFLRSPTSRRLSVILREPPPEQAQRAGTPLDLKSLEVQQSDRRWYGQRHIYAGRSSAPVGTYSTGSNSNGISIWTRLLCDHSGWQIILETTTSSLETLCQQLGSPKQISDRIMAQCCFHSYVRCRTRHMDSRSTLRRER